MMYLATNECWYTCRDKHLRVVRRAEASGGARWRCSPLSLRTRTRRAGGPGTPGTWWLWIFPGWDQTQRSCRDSTSARGSHGRDNTHKQLVGHDDGPVLRVHVELHDVSVPAAIQQLVICEAQMCWGGKCRQISEGGQRSEGVPVTPTEQLGSTGHGCSLEAEAASPGGLKKVMNATGEQTAST